MPQEIFRRLESQSIYDIAISTHGNLESVINLLVDNELDFDSDLPDTIKYEVQDNYIVNYLKGTNITTAYITTLLPINLNYINTGNGDKEDIILTPITTKKYMIKEKQSIYDIALMVTGNLESVIDLMINNSLSFDSALNVGNIINYEGELFISDDITTGGDYVFRKSRAFSDGFHKGFK